MDRHALLVGIDHYDYIRPDLRRCVEDALAMEKVLAVHANNAANYACRTLVGTEPPGGDLSKRVTYSHLRSELKRLFDKDGEVVFYFSGHGIPAGEDTYLATQDGRQRLPGLRMNELLKMANESKAREVLILLDCCYAGSLGQTVAAGNVQTDLSFREGVTLIAASRPQETALVGDEHGVFTSLLLSALEGSAADPRGHVTTASLYAYIEQGLDPWGQRPVHKSNTARLSPIRYCAPLIEDNDLRKLPRYFESPNARYRLAPSYESTRREALPEHVAIFDLFKRYQIAGLLRPSLDPHLYFAAIRSNTVELTLLGRSYWQQAKAGLLGGSPASNNSWKPAIPSAEAVARLFHETYEMLAPHFNYQTREATRKEWEDLPNQNKRLMIAVATELIAKFFGPPDA